MSFEKIVAQLKGSLKTVDLPATAGNVVLNIEAPAGKRYRLLRSLITLVNDATVANRTVVIVLTNGTIVTLEVGQNNTAFTASQTKTVQLSRRNEIGIIDQASPADCELTLPEECLIEGDDEFRITITNGQAGDSYSGKLVVLETDV